MQETWVLKNILYSCFMIYALTEKNVMVPTILMHMKYEWIKFLEILIFKY